MSWILIQHVVTTAILVGVVATACRSLRPGPSIQHGLWLVVLLKFMIPPVVMWPWTVEEVAITAGLPLADSASEVFESGGPAGVWLLSEYGRDSYPAEPDTAAVAAGRYPAERNLSDVTQATAAASDQGRASTLSAAGVTGVKVSWTSRLLAVVAGSWILGSLFVGAWNVRKMFCVRRFVSQGKQGPAWLCRSVERLSRQVGIRAPQLVISGHARTPFVWCFPALRLVWPASLAEPSFADRARGILVHELAHVRRRDHWIAWLDLAVKIVWWWNPLAWYARRRLNDGSELACDAWVIRLLPEQRRAYADSLLAICGNVAGPRLPVPAVGARTGTRRAFERRLTMIMCDQQKTRQGTWAWLCVGCLLLLAVPGFALATRDMGDDEWTPSQPSNTETSGDSQDAQNQEAVPKTSSRAPAISETEAPAAQAETDAPKPADIDAEVFREVLEALARSNSDAFDKQELVEAAIEAMLKKVDENASYLRREDIEALVQSLDGTVGVGVVLRQIEGRLTVINTLPASPAYKAGVRSGDVIEQIDGKSVSDLGEPEELLAAAVPLIRGKSGESVTLGVRHRGSDKLEQIRIVRAAIKLDSVRGYRRLDGKTWQFVVDGQDDIGYVRLANFSKATARDLETAVQDLQSRGVSALVLDLRDCPGGSFQEAIETADLFLREGTIVRVDGTGNERDYSARKKGTYGKMRLAVLIDRGTASAGELVAACLQDHDRATLVGERTFGRGIIQSIVQLKSGEGALRLTTAKLVRPNGKYIHHFSTADESDEWGVRPNEGFEVSLSDEDRKRFQDDRLQRELPTDGDGNLEPFKDSQLERAIQALR